MISCSLVSLNSLVVFSHLYKGIMLKLLLLHFAKCSLTFNSLTSHALFVLCVV